MGIKTMAAISAADVKKLRDITGAGMMDCKTAFDFLAGGIMIAMNIA